VLSVRLTLDAPRPVQLDRLVVVYAGGHLAYAHGTGGGRRSDGRGNSEVVQAEALLLRPRHPAVLDIPLVPHGHGPMEVTDVV
jgi:hypothetical protein